MFLHSKIMCDGWKMIDEVGKEIFEDLAAEGRDIYHKRLAEYRQQQPLPPKDTHHNTTLKVARKSISSEVNELNLSTWPQPFHHRWLCFETAVHRIVL